MTFLYCDCGARTVQGPTIAKFCSGCGQPFVKTSTAEIKKPAIIPAAQPKKRRPVYIEPDEPDENDEIEDENDDDFEIDEDTKAAIRAQAASEPNPLEVEISGPHTVKISDLAKGSKVVPVNKMNLRGTKPKKISDAEFEREWQAEAGTSRRKNK